MGGAASKAIFVVRAEVVGQDPEAVLTFTMLELADRDVNALYREFVKLDTGKLDRVTISAVLNHIGVGKCGCI